MATIISSQNVNHVVTQLHKTRCEEHTSLRKVHRTWTWYASIREGGRFKVKQIKVKPNASISLQKHLHRAEQLIVVSGTAEIINGEKEITLTKNQTSYIPMGEMHRLTNPGDVLLEFIKVESGEYLEEDGIVNRWRLWRM